jgi:hypothetical protein
LVHHNKCHKEARLVATQSAQNTSEEK